MTKIAYMSDLHLEFGDMPVPTNEENADILVVAGDLHVAYAQAGADWLEEATQYFKHVVYVLGNHEFYGGIYHYVIDDLYRKMQPNVHMLHNEVVYLEGIRFIGTTLWTHGGYAGLNDFHVIRCEHLDETIKTLTTRDTRRFHEVAVRFLEDALYAEFDGPTVVVTHHAPIPECVVPKFVGAEPMNQMFHAHLNGLIEENDIDLWIHGHMHDCIDIEYANTRIVCNPRGYVGHGANWGFRENTIVTVA